MKARCVIAFVAAVLMATVANAGKPSAEKDLPDSLLEQVKSTYDGSLQPCYFWMPEKAKDEAVPLIVGLHTWSGDWRQRDHYVISLNYAKKHGWAMVSPNFRGANDHPEACGRHGGNFAAGLDFCSRQEKGKPADFSLPEVAVE